MNLRAIGHDLNLHNNDKFYLILLTIFSVLITIIMVKFHQSRGAFNPDIYVYLASALDFAGMNYNHISELSYMSNSPLICYLTSLLFKLGFVSINSIFAVTAIFSISGIFAMYVFLKIRFSSLLSFVGSLLYSSFSLTLFYFANGMLDVPAVSMILWTLVFTVAAVNKNPKYYILVALFYSFSFFTRFTTAYILSLIVLYILKDYDLINLIECLIYDWSNFKQKIIMFFKSYEFKWMFISLIFGFSIFVYVFYVISTYAPVGYFGIAAGSVGRFVNPNDLNYITDKFFYIKNYLSLLFANKIISPQQIEKFRNPSLMAYLMITILFIGFFIKLINIWKNKDFYNENLNEIPFRSIKSKNFLKILSIVLIFVSVISFKFNYLYSVFFLWVFLLIVMSLSREYDINRNNFSLSLLCFGLFSFYIVIFSFLHLKCVRYILPSFPAFAYFVIYSLDNLLNFIKYGWEDKNQLDLNLKEIKSNFRFRLSQVIPIILVVLLLFTAFNFTNTCELDELGVNFDSSANFLLNYDSNYQSTDIAVDYGEKYYDWYFKKEVFPIVDYSNFNASEFKYLIIYGNEDINPNIFNQIYKNGSVAVYENKYH